MPLAPVPTAPSSILSVLRNKRALYAPMLAIAAFGLVACSGKPENSPVIRKKFAEVDAMKEELTTAITELRAATGQMTILREQVSEIRAFAPDGDGATAIVSRIEAIENRLTALTSTTGSRAVAQADTAAPSSAPATSSAAPSGAPTAATFGGLATPASSSPSTAPTSSFREMTNRTATTGAASSTAATTTPRPADRTTAARSTAPAQTGTGASVPTTQSQPANRGRYYTIETGDTLEKIARDNNIAVETLREANRLPAGARPLKGQRLFIPPARQ